MHCLKLLLKDQYDTLEKIINTLDTHHFARLSHFGISLEEQFPVVVNADIEQFIAYLINKNYVIHNDQDFVKDTEKP